MNPVLAPESLDASPLPAWACLLGLVQAVTTAAGFTMLLLFT